MSPLTATKLKSGKDKYTQILSGESKTEWGPVQI